MVLDSFSANYIGWPTSRLCLSFKVRACLLIDNAKVQHFACASKFRASIWGSFQHEFDEFERNVIHAPQIRNFRASKITFRRFRAGWGIIGDSVVTDDK